MRTDLDHLPPQKQRELERVVQLIFEEFDDAFALAKHEWKKAGRILKVILYGSYARGTWVDEPHTAKGYQSDFDLLIIVSDKRLTDRVKYWAKLDERLMREYGLTGTLRTPVNFIVHTLQEVNDGLAHGRYFFMDVKAEGIAVYQSDDTELHTPKPKTPTQALAMAKEYFVQWMTAAQGRTKLARYAVDEGMNTLLLLEWVHRGGLAKRHLSRQIAGRNRHRSNHAAFILPLPALDCPCLRRGSDSDGRSCLIRRRRRTCRPHR